MGSVALNHSLVLGPDVGHNVLVEELEYEGDTVGEYQVLRHELELVHVVHLEVLEEEQQHCRHRLHNDLLVPVHVDALVML